LPNYLTGLWWALESLAWSEKYLSAVAFLLCRCAEIDPGGNWTNRPGNSLVDIFLPWHPQTCASIEKRAEVVVEVAEAHPGIGWKLLLSLLPTSHAATSGTYPSPFHVEFAGIRFMIEPTGRLAEDGIIDQD